VRDEREEARKTKIGASLLGIMGFGNVSILCCSLDTK